MRQDHCQLDQWGNFRHSVLHERYHLELYFTEQPCLWGQTAENTGVQTYNACILHTTALYFSSTAELRSFHCNVKRGQYNLYHTVVMKLGCKQKGSYYYPMSTPVVFQFGPSAAAVLWHALQWNPGFILYLDRTWHACWNWVHIYFNNNSLINCKVIFVVR